MLDSDAMKVRNGDGFYDCLINKGATFFRQIIIPRRGNDTKINEQGYQLGYDEGNGTYNFSLIQPRNQ